MNTQRLCGPQGQPCQINCGIDCHWETADIETPHDRATRHFWEPDQALHIDSFAEPAEPEANRPWDWIDGYRFWLACALTGLAAGFGWGLGRLFKLF